MLSADKPRPKRTLNNRKEKAAYGAGPRAE